MFDAQEWAARRMAAGPRIMAASPEEPCGDARDMKAALREARRCPWRWRLPDNERRRFMLVYACASEPLRSTYANALFLDEEARHASGR